MPHIYDRIFENYQIVDSDNRPVEDTLSQHAQWLETPGCIFQRNDFHVPCDVKTSGILKPGLFLSIVLEGEAAGRLSDGKVNFRYGENQMTALALREPSPWDGDAARGTHMRAASLAFPFASIDRLGLKGVFLDLFKASGQPVAHLAMRAPPRLQALAFEMLSPTIQDREGHLLLAAQATEVLARSIFALKHHTSVDGTLDQKRIRLQAVKDLVDSDLRYPWSIAELARRAGLSRRSFNIRFRAAYGMSAIDYLRISRLDAAREALVYRQFSVAEAAYHVGYSSPANFATAFRKRFGFAPSRCRSQKTS
jgi:AraC-like DNA-binding protein